MSSRATLADVAALAGVSKAAASAVLGRRATSSIRVGGPTAAAIRDAAQRLGYHPDHTARSLATGRTGAIGFLLSSSVGRGWANAYYASFLPGAEEACRASGYSLCIATAQLAEAETFIRSPILAQRRIDALIVAGELEPATYASLAHHRLPFVVVSAPPAAGLPVIDPLPQIAFLRHLAGLGHRRITVTRDRPLLALGARVDQELDRLRTAGVAVDWCAPADDQHPNWECGHGLGAWLFARWRAQPAGQRASVIVGNAVLHELHRELRQAGLECPRDLQLCGDNAADFAHAYPRFTTVRTDTAGTAAAAVRLLADAITTGTMVDPAACAAAQVAVDIIPGETTA